MAPSSAAAGWVDWDIFQHRQRAAHSARGKNKRVGWEGASKPSGQRPQAQVAGGPMATTRGHPWVLAGRRPPPTAPFILPFLGVEIKTQGWGQPSLRPSQSHQL